MTVPTHCSGVRGLWFVTCITEPLISFSNVHGRLYSRFSIARLRYIRSMLMWDVTLFSDKGALKKNLCLWRSATSVRLNIFLFSHPLLPTHVPTRILESDVEWKISPRWREREKTLTYTRRCTAGNGYVPWNVRDTKVASYILYE